jgi:hypothetical protein
MRLKFIILKGHMADNLSSSKPFNLSLFPSFGPLMKMQAPSWQDTDLPSLEEAPEPPLLNTINPKNF